MRCSWSLILTNFPPAMEPEGTYVTISTRASRCTAARANRTQSGSHPTPCLFKIYFSPIYICVFQGVFPLQSLRRKLCLRAICTHHSVHHRNNIWRIIQIKKLHVVTFSLSFCYLLFQSSTHFLQQVVL